MDEHMLFGVCFLMPFDKAFNDLLFREGILEPIYR
jgi:hypothetical protein